MVTKQQIKSIIKEKAFGAATGPSGGDCKFKGVRKRKWGKYVSEIRLPNSRERIWLGSYDTAEKAARAFDAAMFCLRGRSASFNFPDNPPEIAGGQSLSRSEIQEAAANFANCHTQQQQQQPMSISKDSEVNGYMSETQTQTQTQTQSPSISAISDATVQLELELDLDQQSDLMSDGGSFLDMLTTMGSGNYAADYGYFPEFGDFYSPELPSDVDYGVEHVDGVLPQESFLWNF